MASLIDGLALDNPSAQSQRRVVPTSVFLIFGFVKGTLKPAPRSLGLDHDPANSH